MNATVIASVTDLENMPYALPCDMEDEIRKALTEGTENAIEYNRIAEYNSEADDYVYFPNAGRGGVCCGGNTDWTDCDGLDDLADRWANYEERWCN